MDVISDDLWAAIEPVLPSHECRRGRPWNDHRRTLEGTAWRFRTGSPWRDLPSEFGKWQACGNTTGCAWPMRCAASSSKRSVIRLASAAGPRKHRLPAQLELRHSAKMVNEGPGCRDAANVWFRTLTSWRRFAAIGCLPSRAGTKRRGSGFAPARVGRACAMERRRRGSCRRGRCRRRPLT